MQFFDASKMTFMTPPSKSLKFFKFNCTHDASSELGDASTKLEDASKNPIMTPIVYYNDASYNNHETF